MIASKYFCDSGEGRQTRSYSLGLSEWKSCKESLSRNTKNFSTDRVWIFDSQTQKSIYIQSTKMAGRSWAGRNSILNTTLKESRAITLQIALWMVVRSPKRALGHFRLREWRFVWHKRPLTSVSHFNNSAAPIASLFIFSAVHTTWIPAAVHSREVIVTVYSNTIFAWNLNNFGPIYYDQK
jgi:hypothetical protein